jgi:hypothetical protein
LDFEIVNFGAFIYYKQWYKCDAWKQCENIFRDIGNMRGYIAGATQDMNASNRTFLLFVCPPFCSIASIQGGELTVCLTPK